MRIVLCVAAVVTASLVGFGAQQLEPVPDKLVVLTFDDSKASHYTVVRPLLKKYGFGATFFITEGFTFRTDKEEYLTWAQIAELHRDGFEIGNHTRDHMGLSKANLPKVKEQVDAINAQCAAHGIPAPTSFAYPGNTIDPDAIPILAELGFRFARRGGAPEYVYADGNGFAYEPGRDHPLLLPSAGDARPFWTLDNLKRATNQARNGKIAIIQFHGAPDIEHPWVHTPQERFAEYMKFLHDERFTVIALRDLSKYVDWRQRPADPWLVIEQRKKELGQPSAPARIVDIGGELRQWHKVTLTLDGPQAEETASDPNPFRDYRMTVTFAHESGAPTYNIPGYFAADGNAANTSARAGNKWRAHLAPDKPGRWNWRISFVRGRDAAIDGEAAGNATTVQPFDGLEGSFRVTATNKLVPDFRARGRLEYVGSHYLRFAGTGEYFLKVGSDSPETLLAYADFDDTKTMKPAVPVHEYEPHIKDWANGDPVWKDVKGKGLLGVINYLSSKGANSVSFLTYNAGGDGDNVWPFVSRDDKFHYDVSKLDQWQIVFDHAQAKGLYLHFKLQETENDDNIRGEGGGGRGKQPQTGPIVESLDSGDLGPERKLYLREMIARFGYALALNWNLGEENTQSVEQQLAMSQYIRNLDPYRHHIVVHTHPGWQDAVYAKLLGDQSVLTGASLQNPWAAAHERTVKWIAASGKAGKPWVVANDEQGSALLGVPPDPGYKGFSGKDPRGNAIQSIHDIRKMTLWGNLMAGGGGVEYYFGYTLPENDLVAEDLRSRDKSWDFGRIALDFFRTHKIPFWTMTNADGLVGNTSGDNSKWCFAKAGEIYLVYLPAGGTATLDLSEASGQFTVAWFDPRNGGTLKRGSVASVKAGAAAALGDAPESPSEDWLVVVRR